MPAINSIVTSIARQVRHGHGSRARGGDVSGPAASSFCEREPRKFTAWPFLGGSCVRKRGGHVRKRGGRVGEQEPAACVN